MINRFSAAGALAVLGLALPWVDVTSTVGGTGLQYVPGWCSTFVDANGWAYLDCDPGMLVTTFNSWLSSNLLPGYVLPVRVFAAIAAVLIVVAVQRRNPLAAKAGLIAAVFGLVITGLPTQAGGFAFLGAIVLAWLALRDAGLLGRVPGTAQAGTGQLGTAQAGTASSD